MREDVYRSIEYARTLLENLENLLRSEGNVRASEVRGRLQRFEASVKDLEESIEEWLREDYNELLQSVGTRLENLQRYRPEEYLMESEREALLDKELPYWRGALKAISTALRRWELLLTVLEDLKRECERGKPDWYFVRTRLQELRGHFKTLERTYSECEYAQSIMQSIMVSFEAYLEDARAKSGTLSQSDRDRLAGLCEDWKEGVSTLLYSCRPPVEVEHGAEVTVREKEKQGILVPLLCFEIAGERYSVEASRRRRLVVGRYDPGGLDPVIQGAAPDGLKILEGRSVLYVFNSVECRWGCIEPDRDCTHREHVEVEVEEGAAAIRMAEGAVLPVYYGFAPEERKLLRRTDAVFLKPGQRLYLWISGVYLDARRKREQAPLMLSLESRRGRVTVRPA
jgi:hypothetical protein